jgi:hypothetical protein
MTHPLLSRERGRRPALSAEKLIALAQQDMVRAWPHLQALALTRPNSPVLRQLGDILAEHLWNQRTAYIWWMHAVGLVSSYAEHVVYELPGDRLVMHLWPEGHCNIELPDPGSPAVMTCGAQLSCVNGRAVSHGVWNRSARARCEGCAAHAGRFPETEITSWNAELFAPFPGARRSFHDAALRSILPSLEAHLTGPACTYDDLRFTLRQSVFRHPLTHECALLAQRRGFAVVLRAAENSRSPQGMLGSGLISDRHAAETVNSWTYGDWHEAFTEAFDAYGSVNDVQYTFISHVHRRCR